MSYAITRKQEADEDVFDVRGQPMVQILEMRRFCLCADMNYVLCMIMEWLCYCVRITLGVVHLSGRGIQIVNDGRRKKDQHVPKTAAVSLKILTLQLYFNLSLLHHILCKVYNVWSFY